MDLGDVFGLKGKDSLDQRLVGYNNAARFSPWLVVRDLDSDAPCASALVQRLLPQPSEFMCLRVAVRSVEGWLLADRERMARFLGIAATKVPTLPDGIADPKRLVVELARGSRRSAIRQDIVPAKGTTATVGPGYSARIIEFATKHWRPRAAAERSRSLRRCIAALEKWKSERIVRGGQK